MCLLHVQGCDSLQSGYYENLYKLLESRFADLQWVAGKSGHFLIGKYRKVECSYLLSASKEFAARFQRAEPMLVTVTSRVINLLSVGLLAASPAMVSLYIKHR